MGKTVFQLSPDGGTTKYDLRDSNIAPIELDSAHASQPYAVNEEFVLDADGNLYTATSPISQGSAIVVYPTSGYNCKLSDSVTGQIKDVKDDLDENKVDNSVIGTVEDGAKPSKPYAVGEHFIRNGKFCTCISAVTTSSDWTLNTNYVEGTIADNLAIKGYLGGSDNLNNITTDGIYGFGSNLTNAPNTSIIHGMLIVKHSYLSILTQIIIHDTEGIFVRRYTNSWQPWIKYSAIKSATFSGTTNASGNFSITTDLTRVVLGIELDNDQTALKYKTSNYIGIHIMNASTLEAYAEQSISGTYYYI